MEKEKNQTAQSSEAKDEKKKNTKSFGAAIKKAREAKNITPADLAAQLRISTQILDDMEHLRLSDLPASAFIKGYIRKIASILELDAAVLVEDFSKRTEDAPLLNSTISAEKQSKMNDPIVLWGTAGIILVVVILIVVWIVDALSSPSGEGRDAREDRPAQESSQAVEIQQAPSALKGTLVIENESKEKDSDVNEGASSLKKDEVAGEGEEAEKVDLNQPQKVTQGNDSNRTENSAENSEEKKEEVKNADGLSIARIIPAAPSGGDTLEVAFTGSTWADIKDANEFRLVYGLLTEENGVVSVVGEAPFTIFFGDGKNAMISVNSKPFSFKNKIRPNKTARFTTK